MKLRETISWLMGTLQRSFRGAPIKIKCLWSLKLSEPPHGFR